MQPIFPVDTETCDLTGERDTSEDEATDDVAFLSGDSTPTPSRD
jgi:hypothetical protein